MTTLLLLLALTAGQTPAAVDTTISVMAFNVRYDNPQDGVHAWEYRKERVADIMQRADLVGVQEVLDGQLRDLESMLPGYAWFGVGRDDGMAAGEYSPVFYREDTFELVQEGTYWLSDEPSVPGSVGWDAALPRIVTWGQLRHRDSGTAFWVFNTHFDHRGQEARTQSAALLMQPIEAVVHADPVIVTGDLNASHDSDVYQTMTAGRLVDAHDASLTAPLGPEGTFSGFEAESVQRNVRIDYIFVDRRLAVHSFEVVDDVVAGRYPSDHRPVLATVAL